MYFLLVATAVMNNLEFAFPHFDICFLPIPQQMHSALNAPQQVTDQPMELLLVLLVVLYGTHSSDTVQYDPVQLA